MFAQADCMQRNTAAMTRASLVVQQFDVRKRVPSWALSHVGVVMYGPVGTNRAASIRLMHAARASLCPLNRLGCL